MVRAAVATYTQFKKLEHKYKVIDPHKRTDIDEHEFVFSVLSAYRMAGDKSRVMHARDNVATIINLIYPTDKKTELHISWALAMTIYQTMLETGYFKETHKILERVHDAFNIYKISPRSKGENINSAIKYILREIKYKSPTPKVQHLLFNKINEWAGSEYPYHTYAGLLVVITSFVMHISQPTILL